MSKDIFILAKQMAGKQNPIVSALLYDFCPAAAHWYVRGAEPLALGPCTFAYMAPVLGNVFQTAQTDYIFSIILLAALGIGHCGVIVGAGTLTGKVQKYLNWSEGSKTILWIKRICGVLVILGGVYLIYTVQ